MILAMDGHLSQHLHGKNSVNTVIGVGTLVSSLALKLLDRFEKIQVRMMAATFNSNPSTNIIFCYSPTNASDERPWHLL